VARLTYSPKATLDLERLQDFLAEHDPEWAVAATQAIVHGVSVLEQHPLIGRPAEEGMRELVISRGRTGYVALYDYLEPIDTVVILALRHQREAGYG
jgi:plasmid stabilization system protein ParE